jgi:hypothetical protein
VLPLLLEAEADYSDLYDEQTGRPNWSVARYLGMCLLQEWSDLTDQEAVDRLAFDVRWQYSLAIVPEDAYISRRSYLEFRARLVAADPEMMRLRHLFERVLDVARKDLKVSVSEQRLDSTLITSNITARGRVHLFGSTLHHFYKALTKEWPDEVTRLSAGLRERLEREPDGWFGKKSKEAHRAYLLQLAGWLHEVIEAFADHTAISADEGYQLVKRVFEEHCSIKESGGTSEGGAGSAEGSNSGGQTIVVNRQAKNPGSSLQSPHDPDAGYGHKGRGYSLHITETCRNQETRGTELITDYDVHRAGPDQDKALPAVERLSDGGVQPETLYADAGYASGKSVVAVEELGTELFGPIPLGRSRPDTIGRDQFEIDGATGLVVKCPAGHSPLRQGQRRSNSLRTGKSMHAYFDAATCMACALVDLCCVRPPENRKSGCYQLEVTSRLIARDKRLHDQKTPEFWNRYATRSGVEATMSELKRAHGIGNLRVRRLPKVRLKVSLKVTACNLKRWMRTCQLPSSPTPNDQRVVDLLQGCRRPISRPIAYLRARHRILPRPFRVEDSSPVRLARRTLAPSVYTNFRIARR